MFRAVKCYDMVQRLLLKALWVILFIDHVVGFACDCVEHVRVRDTVSSSSNRRRCRLCVEPAGDKDQVDVGAIDRSRRQSVTSSSIVATAFFLHMPLPASSSDELQSINARLIEVTDPETYSALVYSPPRTKSRELPPLLIAIHGAGKNERNIWNLADIQGEHAGFVPSLLASGNAPSVLLDNFAVVAPYSQGRRSFYQEPRATFLKFVEWVCSDAGQRAGCPKVDVNRIFLFGFSDGATETVELMTTRRFRGAIVASYGFAGTLPAMAIERLKDTPIWVFHSADDVIFPVEYSDRLVAALRKNSSDKSIVRYSRFDKDQEGFTGSVRGHSTGITASRTREVYEWMLSL